AYARPVETRPGLSDFTRAVQPAHIDVVVAVSTAQADAGTAQLAVHKRGHELVVQHADEHEQKDGGTLKPGATPDCRLLHFVRHGRGAYRFTRRMARGRRLIEAGRS